MENLAETQADRNKYLDQDILTPEGSKRYLDLYMSSTAPDENTGKPKGIPAEDFNNFATAIYVLKDHRDDFKTKRENGEKIRHIDSGTGPSIYTIIAALGHVDESIAVELAPSNIQTLEDYKDPDKEFPEFWNAWLDLAVLLHDIGGPDKLLEIDKEVAVSGLNLEEEPNLTPDNQGKINLYDSLRKWPLLSEDTRRIIHDAIYQELEVSADRENPYIAMQEEGLQQVLARKMTVRQGDLYNPLGDDRVPSIADLAGTAHFNTSVYVTESTTRKLYQVLHAENNKAQLSKPDGLWMSCHMAGTEGYSGFLTEEQLAENPDLEHEECPMSRPLLNRVMGEIVKQDQRYLPLSAGPVSEDRRMVRPGKQYSESVIIAGRANYQNALGTLKFENGTQFRHHIRELVLIARHNMHYTKQEAGQAVRDFREKAEKFADGLRPLGNDSVDWDRLNQRFWNKYSELNFDNPIPGDIEGLFNFIVNMRQKKGGSYLDVGTGSAPEFAIAAVAAGMGKVTVSDCAEGALDWLKDELLDDYPLSDRSKMWLDIAKLLSTFEDKEQLLAYCRETGFDKELRQWQKLTPTEKEYWFDDRRYAVEHGQGASFSDSFLNNNEDIKAKIRQMHEEGDFQIQKFSILSPPEELMGKWDLVTANSVASCISEKASEYCQTILNVCNLAKRDGIISTSYTPYDNWKQYTTEAGPLPSISRHNHYYAVAHSLVLQGGRGTDGVNYDRASIAKEIAAVKEATRTGAITFEGDSSSTSLRKPGDNRFEHLIHISGVPEEKRYASAGEMLADFQIHMLGRAESFLLEHPNRHGVNVDPALFRSVDQLEKELGMKVKSGPVPEDRAERRGRLADRIEGIIEHLESHIGVTDIDAMDKRDESISKFIDGIYERLVGRGTQAQMGTNVPAFAAQR